MPTKIRPSPPSPSPSPSPNDSNGFVDSIRFQPDDSADPYIPMFPSAKYWRVIAVCYLLWVLYLVYRNLAFSPIVSGWIWASILSAPLTHVGAFAFIAPLPWILPRRLPSPWRFILGLVLSAITCELAAFLLPAIDGWLFNQANIKFDRARLIQLYLAFVGPAMMVVGGLLAAKARSEELQKALQSEAEMAKNRLLQSQIHPHVLFNALNGLAELIHKNSKGAELAVRHLSDLLRRIMRATEHMRLPLGEERRIITDFLALESIRLQDRLRVRWEWDEELDSIEIPPLLLQPLVENAIKHGIAPSVPGGELVLRSRMSGGEVILEVWNSGEPLLEKVAESGVGLRNLRSRLNLHFGERGSFSLSHSENGTLASIRFEAIQVEYAHEAPQSSGGR